MGPVEEIKNQGADGARLAAERWFHRALLGGDLDIASDVFTPKVVMHTAAGTLRGCEAMQAATLELRALEELSGELKITRDGELLVGRFVVRGRHSRSLWGVEPTGRLVEVQAHVMVRPVGDRLAELWKTCRTRYVDDESTDEPEAQRLSAKPWARRWGLTPQEALVADLAMRGHGDKEIGARLKLATSSVSKYLRGVLRKAGIGSRTALAERAGVMRLG